MALEVQRSFNWKVVLYLFFGGTGGGLFFIGFILERLNVMSPLARWMEALGPVFVLIGCFFLLLHAGSKFKTKIYLLFLKPKKSWISRGTWIISLYVGCAFIHLVFGGSGWGWLAWGFSLLMTIYPGFLLAENKSIPFWRTPALPVLFLFSGLSAGLAILYLMIPLLVLQVDEAVKSVLKALSWSDLFILFTQLVILASFLCMSRDSESTFSKSLRLLRRPLFIFWTLILGLIVPLSFHLRALVEGRTLGAMEGLIAGLLLVIGSISLRFSIVQAGVYLPRHSL